jgi:hypothetical protein
VCCGCTKCNLLLILFLMLDSLLDLLLDGCWMRCWICKYPHNIFDGHQYMSCQCKEQRLVMWNRMQQLYFKLVHCCSKINNEILIVSLPLYCCYPPSRCCAAKVDVALWKSFLYFYSSSEYFGFYSDLINSSCWSVVENKSNNGYSLVFIVCLNEFGVVVAVVLFIVTIFGE